jgi:hypothetical protein
MKKSLSISFVILLIEGFYLSAQDTLSKGKALNFPFRKYGVSIGNSYAFTGIRINFADKNVKKINGLNVTFWVDNYQPWELKNQIYSSSINGISFGLLPTAGSMQPINLGLFRVAAEKNLNGLTMSGLNTRSNGNINGICISGLTSKTESTFSGIALSGIGFGAMKLLRVWEYCIAEIISMALAFPVFILNPFHLMGLPLLAIPI